MVLATGQEEEGRFLNAKDIIKNGIIYFSKLIKNSQAITTTESHEVPQNGKVERPPMPAPEDQFDDTYSSKSTVIITDEFHAERS